MSQDLVLSTEDAAIVAEELALHEKVKQAVKVQALAKVPNMGALQTQLKELRDEAITASERDLPALFQALYTHHSLAARTFEKKLPDMRAPYFARMRLVEGRKARDVLIGYQTFIDSDAGVTIIDWRHAALAKVFFNFREGDEYEIELPGRIATGKMVMRRVVTFDMGELTAITGSDFTLARESDRSWRRIKSQGAPQLAGGQGKAVNVNQFAAVLASRKLPDVSALLDQNQYEILNKKDEGALLILGGAGSGKTTIALHRLALLNYRRPRFYAQQAMKVVVPEQGLVRLTQRLLRGLGMDDVSVETFDAWVSDQGQHILKGIPRRICQYTPSAVVFIKRHPAMLALLDKYEEVVTNRLAERMRFLIEGMGDVASEFTAARRVPLMTRIERLEERCIDTLKKQAGGGGSWNLTNAQGFFKEAKELLLDVETARSELFTNAELLQALMDASGGAITDKMVAELKRHQKKQFEEHSLAHLDPGELKEKKEIDEAELEADDFAGTMDVEDYAVLLNWMLRVHGRVARKTKSVTQYKHLVIDETQDLSPIELKILGQSLAADGTVSIAGDAAQQSDPTVVFRGWDDILTQLELADVEEARLTTNYRCPRPIAEFGHQVLGPLAPAEVPRSVRDGMDVVVSVHPNEGLAVVAMTEALNQLFDKERLASVAIIAENEENARAWYSALTNVDDVRLVVDGEFEFKPGIDVTDVSQIKGLEFDYVIIPDANAATYPDTPVARRTMHIAVTRAVHQLWVIAVGKPSEILPKQA